MKASRKALVTGSASGIGQATVQRLSAAGWQVLEADREHGDIHADLSNAQGRQALIDAVNERTGSLDAVITCAGTGTNTPLDVSVNYFGTVSVIEGLMPLLAKGTQPRVVAVVSSAIALPFDQALVSACLADDETAAREHASVALPGTPLPVYASSKVALARWLRRNALRRTWLDNGILLNGVAPGITVTGMTAPMLADAQRAAFVKHSAPCPVGRFAQPSEIAQVIHFLASAENSFIVGQTIFVDGGAEVTLRGDVAI